MAWHADEESVRKVLLPRLLAWCSTHCESPNLAHKRFHKNFRKRFRMPYPSHLLLVEEVKSCTLFKRWKDGNTDALGNKAAPLELLVLTALRHLGRGWTFDDLAEQTAISEEVIRVHFHKFIEWGSTVLFSRHVTAPQDLVTTLAQEHEFRTAGLPGCVGSMDATHVALEKCSFRLRQAHLAQKLPHAARTYNIVVNHRRRILSTTHGHPARWNDKSLVKFDPFVMGLKKKQIHQDLAFELCDYDAEGLVIRVKHRGAWLLVDNGYHRWSVTVPPIKTTTIRAEIRFSQWLESMRKDVECTFGTLKGRWHVLKAGIRLFKLQDADHIWATCCALHNLLLEVDGLDNKWEDRIVSEWQGALGEHDNAEAMPQAIRRLLTPAQARNYDTSGMGNGTDRICVNHNQQDTNNQQDTETPPVVDLTGHIVVGSMSLQAFRDKLIRHFDIALQ